MTFLSGGDIQRLHDGMCYFGMNCNKLYRRICKKQAKRCYIKLLRSTNININYSHPYISTKLVKEFWFIVAAMNKYEKIPLILNKSSPLKLLKRRGYLKQIPLNRCFVCQTYNCIYGNMEIKRKIPKSLLSGVSKSLAYDITIDDIINYPVESYFVAKNPYVNKEVKKHIVTEIPKCCSIGMDFRRILTDNETELEKINSLIRDCVTKVKLYTFDKMWKAKL